MKTVKRRLENGKVRYKNILYKAKRKAGEWGYIDVILINDIPDPDLYKPIAKASYYKETPFTRDYRDRPYWNKPKFSSFDDVPETSQDAVNDDLPSLPWIISGCLIAIGVLFIWVWLVAILMHPQITPDTLAVYNADLPISEHNNQDAALSLTPSSVLPRRLSGALPDGNGLFSPSESVLTPPISVSPSAVPQPLYEGAFYTSTPLSTGASAPLSTSVGSSDTSARTEQGRSELLELSGVLDNTNVNDGWGEGLTR